MMVDDFFGLVSLVAGLFAVVYVFRMTFKFMKGLRYGFMLIAFGILFVFLSMLSMVAHVLGGILEPWNHITILIFLGIAALLVALGSSRILNIIKNIDGQEVE